LLLLLLLLPSLPVVAAAAAAVTACCLLLLQAMENSVELDYVSEKVYHALESGCIPIYYGAPNVADYVPEPDSIIDYAQLGSPAALLAELERLAGNDTAYQAKMAWRKKPLKDLSPVSQASLTGCYTAEHSLSLTDLTADPRRAACQQQAVIQAGGEGRGSEPLGGPSVSAGCAAQQQLLVMSRHSEEAPLAPPVCSPCGKKQNG